MPEVKSIKVTGYIDVPAGWEFPDIDYRTELKPGTLVVTGDGRHKRSRGNTNEITKTLTTRLEGGAIGKVLEPLPQTDENQATISDAEQDEVGKRRGRTGKAD